MKKIILTVVAVFAFGFANAQETKEAKEGIDVKFGVKVGLNLDSADSKGKSVFEFRPEAGGHIGGFAEIKLCDQFSFQPELLYSYHILKFGAYINPNGTLELGVIEVPLLGKFHLYKGLSLEAGPQFDFIVSGRSSGQDVKDTVRTFNVGAASGLAYDFEHNIFVQARYVYNFLDLLNTPTGNNLYGVQFSVGYKF